jgi:tRNA(fMet)-specific endonuclease VapC
MFLLDTDIVSYAISRRPPPALLARLAAVPAAHQVTSTITVAELVAGAYRSGRPALFIPKIRAVTERLSAIPFDADAAWRYGELHAELLRRGTPRDHPDLQIAAIALSRGLVLVTHNLRHFARVSGLLIEDWTLAS